MERSWEPFSADMTGDADVCIMSVCMKITGRTESESHGSRMYARPAERKINKVSLIAFKSNELGNHFWKDAGWCFREDLNYYDFTLNEANITRFNQ